jgi:hypothetical protein
MKVKKVTIPADSLVRACLPADYSDGYACRVESPRRIDPDLIMIEFWTNSCWWVRGLFRLRDFLVRFVGLQGSGGIELAKFREAILQGGSHRFMSVPAKNDHETVVLLSDKHLDAWLSIHIAEDGGGAPYSKTVAALTVVRFRNRLGRVYLFFIRPFHAIIVKTMLRGAIKKVID